MSGLGPFRLMAVWLALSALMVRTLVPVGWMPSAAASHSTLMPCPMMDGMKGMAMSPALPAKHAIIPSHEGSICPFATPAEPIRVLDPHRIEITRAQWVSFRSVALSVASDWDHIPRGPPTTA